MTIVNTSVQRMFYGFITVLGIGLFVIPEGMTAPATSSVPGKNSDRATNCRNAGGTASESGSTLTCTLRDDNGKQCTVVCQDGGGCGASGAGCDEFGGADAISIKRPPVRPKRPLLNVPRATAPMIKRRGIESEPPAAPPQSAPSGEATK